MALGHAVEYAALAKEHVTGKNFSHFSKNINSFWKSNRVLLDYAEKGSPDVDIEIRGFVKSRFMERHPAIINYFNSFD